MALPILTTGEMMGALGPKEKAVCLTGDMKDIQVFYHESELRASYPGDLPYDIGFLLKKSAKELKWVIKPEYAFVSFEEALEVYKRGDLDVWVALLIDNEEVKRFKDHSMYFVQVIENGFVADVRKSELSFSIREITGGKWAIVDESEDL